MSTFFRSAAMTLLSKTLQTLLYKYLSDVDVEGVALPSLYNTESHSGWGVRLSNVKLREGAKLMDLPGRPRKRRRRRGKRQKEGDSPKSRSLHQSPSNLSMTEEREEEIRHKDSVDPPGELGSPPRSFATTDEPTVGTTTVETTTSLAEETNSVSKQPSTTRHERKRSSLPRWFSWSSRVSVEQPIQEEETVEHEEQQQQVDSKDHGDDDSKLFDISQRSIPVSEFANESQSSRLTSSRHSFNDSAKPTLPMFVTSPARDGHHNQPNAVDDEASPMSQHGHKSSINEEQDEEEEQTPMILRLGKNGSIGVLDVRLIGKTMHVLMEDASLSVEVVQLYQDLDDETASDKETTTKAASSSKSASASAQPPPKTVGDRVLAEIAMARIFSAIPNLFLRDIRLRIIIRGQDSTSLEEPSDKIGLHDSVLEFSIELLSVTDGEDFLANFRAAAAHADDEDEVVDDEESRSSGGSTDESETGGVGAGDDRGANLSGTDKANEFETKRIRTGRGPDGGVVLRVYSGSDSSGPLRDDDPDPPLWARQSWRAATDHYALRISGLDLQARMFMGEKDDTSMTDFMFEDFNVDTLLYGGVDYIAPGPQPPLPPMLNNRDSDEGIQDQPWTIPGATTYVTDSNGVQRCGVGSSFHRVARGLRPGICQSNHLPCEQCAECWTGAAPGVSIEGLLDSSTPMGGLVLHASLRDPLEINLDRQTLEQIGLLLDLFKKKELPPDDEPPAEVVAAGVAPSGDEPSDRPGLDESLRSNRSTRSLFSRTSTTNIGDDSTRGRMSRASSLQREDSFRQNGTTASIAVDEGDVVASYPPYMQPEKIQILGLHLSQVKLRIHVLRSDGTPDDRLSFCYWDLETKCVTMDVQQLTATERPFKDIRIDIGNLKFKEFSGQEKRQLASLGLRQKVIEFDEITVETLMTREPDNARPPWPSTAAALLDVPPPLESLVYESRERHAFQLRYVSVVDPITDAGDKNSSSAMVRLGSTFVYAPFAIKDTLLSVIDQAQSIVVGDPEPSGDARSEETTDGIPDENDDHAQVDSRLLYKIQLDGGKIKMDPLMEVSFPFSTVTGEKSSLAGLSFETFLNSVKLKYSKPAPRAAEHGLSLQQIADLPENVRLRLLLFLPDLKALELALGIKTEPNSFLRCRAVNKGLVKAARKHARLSRTASSGGGRSSKTKYRRDDLMVELMKLGDEELEDLWITHLRNKRKNSSGSRLGAR